MRFSRREVRDLLIAWLALGVAFTLFLRRDVRQFLLGQAEGLTLAGVGEVMAISLLTVGVGFLLHELAHKVVAVRFGQVAEFRADYQMLGLAIIGGLIGFLFAAPGAVYHRGRISPRENGLVSLAGPVTNLGLAVVFLAVLVSSFLVTASDFVVRVGLMGVRINLLLAGFNMIPWGPLDGRKVLAWSKVVYAVVAVPSIALGALALFVGF